MRIALHHQAVAGDHLARSDEQPVTDGDGIAGDFLDRAAPQAVGACWRRRFKLLDRARGTARGVPLERLAPGLHEHHDQSRNRVLEENCCENGERGYDIRGKPAPQGAPERAPDDRQSHHDETGQPDPVRPDGRRPRPEDEARDDDEE